jgi:hypothetical protein
MANNNILPLILFSDGTASQIVSIPTIEKDSDGVECLVFHLRPSKIQVNKFNIRDEDYDNEKEGLLVRTFPKVECIGLGEGYVEKDLVEWFNHLTKLGYILNEFIGSEDFQKFNELTKKVIKKKKLSVGVIKLTDNPQSKYHYFCLSDLNNGGSAVAKHFSELLMENVRLQKENFRLKGYVERLTYDIQLQSTQEEESLKNIMSKVDIVGKPSPQPPTNEEQASKDQHY